MAKPIESESKASRKKTKRINATQATPHVPKRPKPKDDRARVDVPFTLTQAAFGSLVTVETYSRMVKASLDEVHRLVTEVPPQPGFSYVALPTETDDDELRELITRQREAKRAGDSIYWPCLDRYHAADRRWRKAIDAALVAADNAAFELDLPSTPPLERTSVAIKRTLQRLGSSIPPPAYVGDMPRLDFGWLTGMRVGRKEVADWIDELRLLIYPRSHSNEELALGAPATPGLQASPEINALTDMDLNLLEAMATMGAVDEDSRKSMDDIARHAIGTSASGYVKARSSVLVDAGMVGTKTGQQGGTWITERGLAALRIRRQWSGQT